ncbi:hypothetical protein [uncultured Bacteroides sp.]|uniref:hypothetical protein n=1 Tax=uncultured Bacteroides sp. TaxID=162156 RepID=UPI002AA73BDB|nr:hypothetical protein [uncultured Bacteroides sp.]
MRIANKIIFSLMIVFSSMSFIGCGDDDDNVPKPTEDEVPEFVLAQDLIKVKIGPDNKVNVDVKEGGGEYNAFILDSSVATAEVTDGVIKVEGLQNGQTSLIVSDKYSRYRKVPVSVYTTDTLKLSTVSFDLVTPLGNSATSKANVVLGNGGYAAVSDNSAVSVSVDEDGEISMAATSKKDEYTANVTVTDCSGLSASIAVKVTASLEPFSDEDLATIMSDNTRRYYYNNSRIDASYYTYLNQKTDDGKQRYGWDYYGYYWCYVDFAGDKFVGDKEDGNFVYHTWSSEVNTPVTLKIVKNDGTNIWGIFSYVNDAEEKLYAGYFCDAVGNE